MGKPRTFTDLAGRVVVLPDGVRVAPWDFGLSVVEATAFGSAILLWHADHGVYATWSRCYRGAFDVEFPLTGLWLSVYRMAGGERWNAQWCCHCNTGRCGHVPGGSGRGLSVEVVARMIADGPCVVVDDDRV